MHERFRGSANVAAVLDQKNWVGKTSATVNFVSLENIEVLIHLTTLCVQFAILTDWNQFVE